MVPWHPPCALISLIFSSLDPETNCFCRFIVVCFSLLLAKNESYLLLRFATGLIIESFSVQLSRCSADGFPSSGFVFQTLKAIQNEFAKPTVSVTRLASLADLRFGIQLAQRLFAAMLVLPCGSSLASQAFV